MSDSYSLDGFLGGRLTIAQPKRGFRAGHDTVLLAAAVPAHPPDRLLELGSGAGVASLCLASRVSGIDVIGVEIEPDLVRLASENAARNGMAERLRFQQGNAAKLSFEPESFDHVFFNPPFHPVGGDRSPDPAKDRAMRDTGEIIQEWTRIALGLTRAGGTTTAIIRADRVLEMQDPDGSGDVVIFPLFPHRDEAPKRAIVQISKTGMGSVRHAAGLVLHEQDGRNTPECEAVLRHGVALSLA